MFCGLSFLGNAIFSESQKSVELLIDGLLGLIVSFSMFILMQIEALDILSIRILRSGIRNEQIQASRG